MGNERQSSFKGREMPDIINIEREIRNNEIVIDVWILLFEFIDTATA